MDIALPKLNPRRMLGLSRIALVDEWRPYLLTGLVIGSLLLFANTFFRALSVGFFFNIMLLFGVVMVSRAFSEAHEKEKGIHYFMVPAAVEEKFFLKLLVTLVGFYLFTLLVCLVANRLAGMLSPLLSSSTTVPDFDPLQPEIFDKFKRYLFFHSLYFAGSLFFKKSNFLKTSFVLLVVTFVLFLVVGSYLKDYLIQSQAGRGVVHLHFNNLGGFEQVLGISADSFSLVFQVAIYIVMPLLLYSISFFKFKNLEVTG